MSSNISGHNATDTVDSSFGDLPLGDDFNERHSELISAIKALPIRPESTLSFVDFDDTIFDGDRRYDVYPELRNYRGDLAYAELARVFGSPADPSGFVEFVRRLDPKNHLLDYGAFFDPKNPDNIILTAGNIEYQSMKVAAAGLSDVPAIFVMDAQDKPLAILEEILERGYVPGRVNFTDDRIGSFTYKDTMLASILGVPVDFYRAEPDSTTHKVGISLVTNQELQRVLLTSSDVARATQNRFASVMQSIFRSN